LNLTIEIMKKQLLLIISFVLINQTTYGQQVTIGTQMWQTTNLDVTSYRDGTPIPQVTDPTAWAGLTTGAWCYYNNIVANGTTYGKLYNWYAVAGIYDTDPSTPNKTLAPSGYHIPSDAEWTTLTTYLGGESLAGGTMKSNGTTLWTSPNTSATNSSGFTGLPGGYRFGLGTFFQIGDAGIWWSSTLAVGDFAWFRVLNYNSGDAYRNYGYSEINGLSVRCLSDSSLSNPTFDTSSLQLYPNPVLSVLNVKVDSYLINQPYTIIDGIGRVVLNGKLNEVDTAINVEQLSKGIYYLKVSDRTASKFIKD
jgi:uncharacterized protein (TIGR02145 family)